VYRIDWSEDAGQDLFELPVFWRRRVASAVDRLVHDAETESRNRKRLRRRLDGLAGAEWNLRVGEFRVFYQVIDERIARILRVILKGAATTDRALSGSPKR